MKLTCFILHKQPKVVKLLTKHIGKTDGLTLLGTNSNPESFLRRRTLERLNPDIVFLDFEPLKTTSWIAAAMRILKIKFIFASKELYYGPEAFRFRATYFIVFPFTYDIFTQSIERVKEYLTIEKRKSL